MAPDVACTRVAPPPAPAPVARKRGSVTSSWVEPQPLPVAQAAHGPSAVRIHSPLPWARAGGRGPAPRFAPPTKRDRLTVTLLEDHQWRFFDVNPSGRATLTACAG